MHVSKFMLVIALPLTIVGCNRTGPTNNGTAASNGSGNAASSASVGRNNSDGVAATPSAAAGEIQGTFRSFERGDHLYAMFDLPAGREAESTVLIRDVELAAFLSAHKGKSLNLVIQTRNERLDPPGENMDVTSLVSARSSTETSQAWWQSLSVEQQTAARGEIEVLPAAGGGG